MIVEMLQVDIALAATEPASSRESLVHLMAKNYCRSRMRNYSTLEESRIADLA